MSSYLFTSESVSAGHPDKVADAISDTVLDLYLDVDPNARVACETLCTTNFVMIAGEIKSAVELDPRAIQHAVRETVREIGYEQDGFHWDKFEFVNKLHAQSADIAQGVDIGERTSEGAGDQGLMFGYAVDETPTLMPAPLYYAHRILSHLNYFRLHDSRKVLLPDAKSQVTFVYENGVPKAIDTIVVSTQHTDGASQQVIRDIVREVCQLALPEQLFLDWEDNGKLYVNPTGKFVIGGPDGDTGLTGRKIIVDTYGGAAPHGGGAFSGKDPTKVDRSAAYMARYLAKNIVASGYFNQCTIQLAYAIGVPEPVSVSIDPHNPNPGQSVKVLEDWIMAQDFLTPRGIRNKLGLNAPIYKQTSSYGHFGREDGLTDAHFSWERRDLVDELKKLIHDSTFVKDIGRPVPEHGSGP